MKEQNTINGCLDAFFETGTEGVIWSICDDTKSGYESLVMINEGDYIKVYTPEGAIYWEGLVVYDTWSNWRNYPLNSSSGQQTSCGMWVHWLQINTNSEDWGNMFFNGLRAEVIKKYNSDKDYILKLKKEAYLKYLDRNIDFVHEVVLKNKISFDFDKKITGCRTVQESLGTILLSSDITNRLYDEKWFIIGIIKNKSNKNTIKINNFSEIKSSMFDKIKIDHKSTKDYIEYIDTFNNNNYTDEDFNHYHKKTINYMKNIGESFIKSINNSKLYNYNEDVFFLGYLDKEFIINHPKFIQKEMLKQ
jgi:hypothetical protein